MGRREKRWNEEERDKKRRTRGYRGQQRRTGGRIHSRLSILSGAGDGVEVCVGEGKGVVGCSGEPALHSIVPVTQHLWKYAAHGQSWVKDHDDVTWKHQVNVIWRRKEALIR